MLQCWPDPGCSSSWCCSMSLVSARSGHAVCTDLPDCIGVMRQETRADERNRTVDLLITMSIPGRDSTAAMLVRAGFVVVLVLVNVSGFRLVLARGWHGPTPPYQGMPSQAHAFAYRD